jgi:hypothetical protein
MFPPIALEKMMKDADESNTCYRCGVELTLDKLVYGQAHAPARQVYSTGICSDCWTTRNDSARAFIDAVDESDAS